MTLEPALAALALQGALGAWDNIRNHEFREGLPYRTTQRRELLLHAARQGLYLVLFPTMAGLEWRGWCAWLLLCVVAVEIVVTCWDFHEEDRTRHLSAEERVLHTLLTLNHGVFLGLLLPVLLDWAGQPAEIITVQRGGWAWLMGAYSLGVLGFGLRELLAGLAMQREAMLPPGDPPHLRALGAVLPVGLRTFHGGDGVRHASGSAQVVLGNWPARWVLRLLGMGLVAGSQSLAVTFTPDGAGELWTRRFGAGGFITRITANAQGRLEECFGPFKFAFRLSAEAGELRWAMTGSWLFGLPLPRALWPRVTAREWGGLEGSYCMAVNIALPLLGPLVRYEGTLEAD